MLAWLGVAHVGVQTAPAPLQLALACEHADEPRFRMTLRNTGQDPTAALMGAITGKWFRFSQLSFTVGRRDAADVGFDYVDPAAPAAGSFQFVPWVVRLPAGASYSTVVAIPGAFRHRLAGSVTVRARLIAQPAGDTNLHALGLEPTDLWAGVLESAPIPVPDSCRAPK